MLRSGQSPPHGGSPDRPKTSWLKRLSPWRKSSKKDLAAREESSSARNQNIGSPLAAARGHQDQNNHNTSQLATPMTPQHYDRPPPELNLSPQEAADLDSLADLIAAHSVTNMDDQRSTLRPPPTIAILDEPERTSESTAVVPSVLPNDDATAATAAPQPGVRRWDKKSKKRKPSVHSLNLNFVPAESTEPRVDTTVATSATLVLSTETETTSGDELPELNMAAEDEPGSPMDKQNVPRITQGGWVSTDVSQPVACKVPLAPEGATVSTHAGALVPEGSVPAPHEKAWARGTTWGGHSDGYKNQLKTDPRRSYRTSKQERPNSIDIDAMTFDAGLETSQQEEPYSKSASSRSNSSRRQSYMLTTDPEGKLESPDMIISPPRSRTSSPRTVATTMSPTTPTSHDMRKRVLKLSPPHTATSPNFTHHSSA